MKDDHQGRDDDQHTPAAPRRPPVHDARPDRPDRPAARTTDADGPRSHGHSLDPFRGRFPCEG